MNDRYKMSKKKMNPNITKLHNKFFPEFSNKHVGYFFPKVRYFHIVLISITYLQVPLLTIGYKHQLRFHFTENIFFY
jgi:hypothetical protein